MSSHANAGDFLVKALSAGEELTFAWCPPGAFIMGSPEGDPLAVREKELAHSVQLTRGFWMAITPITQRVWTLVTGTKHRLYIEDPEADVLPVHGTTWKEAREFCSALTHTLRRKGLIDTKQLIDLPTEAQWEYACRAGTSSTWYFGDDVTMLGDHAWFRDNSEGSMQAVGRKLSNPWNLFDMYGNVAEWCLDGLTLFQPGQAASDPMIPGSDILKIARGGAYDHLAKDCRSANRETIGADNGFIEASGIRVVLIDGVS